MRAIVFVASFSVLIACCVYGMVVHSRMDKEMRARNPAIQFPEWWTLWSYIDYVQQYKTLVPNGKQLRNLKRMWIIYGFVVPFLIWSIFLWR